MIVSIDDRATEALFCHGTRPRWMAPALADVVVRKLDMLDAASRLADLRVPPGNRLEALYGDRMGQHSIRINGQWRIVFRWIESHAHDVAVVDYH
jgi:proteic killer suppression protein